ncbi:hypothetical protein [Kibdelosporangium phytohabitans]|uniref:Secreted protein n=1 Tax=Kibdelosporangium phytohabitans TaxID=860235 RepID=A0A0N9I0Z8_9PSEU|nr:hypothetical protein [Kibdelosporangium phytohabitans]ALG07865.1 hypothetical protein AOZ06_13920 [Kibdelosporangium phytohabitans]MBE1471208.1 hypothetical protein [Kibdelosporangium phytohabitans]
MAMRTLPTLLLTLGMLFGIAAPALADGAQTGADIHVAQTLGDRELTVIIRRVAEVPGPVHVDLVTHAGSPPGVVTVSASAAGSPTSTTKVELGAKPGFHAGTVQVDRPGPWELKVDEATIPFVVPAIVASPWETATYGGFVAAGLLLVVALVLAVRGRVGMAVVPAAGMIAAIAAAATAALLAPVIPAPPAPGADLDPTFDNVNDPYQRTSITDFSRPPVNLVPGMAGNDLRLSLTDGSSGRPVDDLLVHDNALIHLVVISPSGALQHLHPIRVAPGDYRARLKPEPGVHAIAAEIARRGGGVQLLRSSVEVTGEAQNHPIERKADLVTQIRPAGTPSTITAKFGTKDLQPWLGMLGHMIVVGPIADGRPQAQQNHADARIWAHVHSMIPSSPGLPGKPDESVAAYGPDVPFTYSFPMPGRYLVWIQVERDYSILIVPTVVEVPKGTDG